MWEGYMDLGKPDKICPYCKAIMWNNERNNKSMKNARPTFSICCRNGQVLLPPEKSPPPFLANLLSGGQKSKHYKKKIRIYNSLFAFTSLGGKIDNSINRGRAPYTFKLCGQNYHLIGSICPTNGETPKFCQLYVYDTENEIENRQKAVPGGDSTDPSIVQGLLLMLDENNRLVHSFRMARDRFKNNEPEEVELELVSCKSASGRPNTVGPSNEVGALIVGDLEDSCGTRDIVVQMKNKKLQRIFETNAHFMPLQYPLIFPHGDEGFHTKIPLMGKHGGPPPKIKDDDDDDEESKQRCYVSMREYYAYKLMIRAAEGIYLLLL